MDWVRLAGGALMRWFVTIGIVIAIVTAVLVNQRHTLLIYALSSEGQPALLEAQEEGPDVRWFDDYFTVQELDARTFAIGEPRYYQQNYAYLIVGTERAVLFDAGPGHRDIRPVASSLTDLPITFVPSHFHYDHTGNEITFDHVAVVDLPYLRARAVGNRLPLTDDEHVGWAEGVENIALEVDEWIAPGSEMFLGERTLQVVYTPGHTEESISLLDKEAGQLFSGDFIYPGPLFAMLPNSGMGDYALGTKNVSQAADQTTRIYAAHRLNPPGAPVVTMKDIEDLENALDAIKTGALQGSGIYPVVYPINDNIELYAEPSWFQDWTPNIEARAGR